MQSGRSSKVPVFSDRRQGLVTAGGHWMRAGGMTCDIRGERWPPLQLLGRSFIIRQTRTHIQSTRLKPHQESPSTRPDCASSRVRSAAQLSNHLLLLSSVSPPSGHRADCCSSIPPSPTVQWRRLPRIAHSTPKGTSNPLSSPA